MRQINLTEKQLIVAKGLLRRLPYKAIAADLCIAESTVNDHIRALRRKLDANTTQQLVEALLASELVALDTPQNGGQPKNRVEVSAFFEEPAVRNDEFYLADAASAFPIGAGLQWPGEPNVVPEELDGPNAIAPRLQAIGKTLAWLLAALVLTVAALNGINSLVLDIRPASETD